MPNEAEFLTAQADAAKARLQVAARGLRDGLLAPVDIRAFVRNRPWWSVGSAALGGFLCGIVGGRRRQESKLDRPEPSAPKVPGMLAVISQRIRRVATSAIGTLILAQFQTPAAPEQTPSSSSDEAA